MQKTFNGIRHGHASGWKKLWLSLFKRGNSSKISMVLYAKGTSLLAVDCSLYLKLLDPFHPGYRPVDCLRLYLTGAQEKHKWLFGNQRQQNPWLSSHPSLYHTPGDSHMAAHWVICKKTAWPVWPGRRRSTNAHKRLPSTQSPVNACYLARVKCNLFMFCCAELTWWISSQQWISSGEAGWNSLLGANLSQGPAKGCPLPSFEWGPLSPWHFSLRTSWHIVKSSSSMLYPGGLKTREEIGI